MTDKGRYELVAGFAAGWLAARSWQFTWHWAKLVAVVAASGAVGYWWPVIENAIQLLGG